MGVFKRDILGLSDKAFYRKVFAVSVPIMLQQLLVTAMYMVDTMMIGGLGDIELAGVGAANQLTYVLDICLFGITGGGSVFVAQYFGKKETVGIKRTLGLILLLAAVVAGVFVAIARFAGTFAIGLFSDDAAVVASGLDYLSIAAWGYLLKAVIYPYGTVHKATGHAKLPMLSNGVGLLSNMFLNWVFIFGNLGCPALGVKGAAYATLIGSFLDAAVLLLLSYLKDTYARAKFREMFTDVFANVREFIRVSTPVLLDDSIWVVGQLMLNFVYGQMGTATFAAMMIVGTVDKLAFILLQSIGTASAVVLGNTLGDRDSFTHARTYASRFLWLSGLVGAATGVVVCLAGIYVPYLYTNTNPETQQLAIQTIFTMGPALPLWALNFTIICGVLRSGGDTHAAAIIDLAPLWAISVPLAMLTGLYFKLPLPAVYMMQHIAAVVRLFFALRRSNQGLWIRRLV
ncbi:MAG: MATE family efflux transporter [Clostridia bacterium]|nr:MATE family efflux transporter [Clostridia bacterium]